MDASVLNVLQALFPYAKEGVMLLRVDFMADDMKYQAEFVYDGNVESAPEPATESEDTWYVVADDKSVARKIKGYNEAEPTPRPIMVIYEDAEGNRVRFNEGESVRVFPEEVRADGGSIWYELFSAGEGERLFVEKAKGYLTKA